MKITLKAVFESADHAFVYKMYAELITKPEEEYTDVSISFPGGLRSVKFHHYRMKDYFTEIKVEMIDSLSFNIIFHSTKNGGYWKDMVLHVIRDLEKLSKNNSIKFFMNGHEIPSNCKSS